MTIFSWTSRTVTVALLMAALVTLAGVSIADRAVTQYLFVYTTYYLMMGTVLCWVGTYLYAARDLQRETVALWVRENWPGLCIALSVTIIAAFAIEPALRILSDETNLVGTSKNLFVSKTATFTVSGKNYYGSYWDVDVAIDRRPTLFPFLVSLVHSLKGYSYENAFLVNLLLLPGCVLVAYRLAKSLAGETYAIVASFLVAAHPITLLSVRSGAFDFLAVFLALLVMKSLFDFLSSRRAAELAILWMNLCMFAEVRYESALFIPPVVVLLLLFKTVTPRKLRPYAFVYALTPVFLLPRLWQSILRGNVPEQDLGTATFSLENFFNNAYEYFKPILEPSHHYPFHSTILIGLGVLGCLLWLKWLVGRVHDRDWDPKLKFAVLVAVWMLTQAFIVFTYVWGRAQHPISARLVITVDTFFSFAAAWVLTLALKRYRPFVPVLIAAAVFAAQLPGPSQLRMLNTLTQTRENAATWNYFERLGDKRILIVTDRPSHFTIMDYGAMSFEKARSDPYLFKAFERHLFHNVYVIQQVQLSTKRPLPGYEIWPDRKLESVLEFQNDANVLVRVSRLARF